MTTPNSTRSRHRLAQSVLDRQECRALSLLQLLCDHLGRYELDWIASLARDLFEDAVPCYRIAASKSITPIDHHAFVAHAATEIGLGMSGLQDWERAVLTLGGLVHDVGLAEEEEKLTSSSQGAKRPDRVAQRLRHGQVSAQWLDDHMSRHSSPFYDEREPRSVLLSFASSTIFPALPPILMATNDATFSTQATR